MLHGGLLRRTLASKYMVWCVLCVGVPPEKKRTFDVESFVNLNVPLLTVNGAALWAENLQIVAFS